MATPNLHEDNKGKVSKIEAGGGEVYYLNVKDIGEGTATANYVIDKIYDKDWNTIIDSEEEIQQFLDDHVWDYSYASMLHPYLRNCSIITTLVYDGEWTRFTAIDYNLSTMRDTFRYKKIYGDLVTEYTCEIYYDDDTGKYLPKVTIKPIEWRIPLKYVATDHYTVSDVTMDDIKLFVRKGGTVTFYYTAEIYTVSDIRNAIVGSAVAPKTGGGFEMRAMRMENDTDVYITTLQF